MEKVKRAKILDDGQMGHLLSFVDETSKFPERDRVMVLLGFKAGLRATEIANISWADLTDAEGQILQTYFIIRSPITKGDAGDRKVPMHPALYKALVDLRKEYPHEERPMFASRGGPMSGNNCTVYLWRLYRKAGFEGVSSHSGRRTFITRLCRSHSLFDCSLRDVQMLVGHARLTTTQRYVEPSEGVGAMVSKV